MDSVSTGPGTSPPTPRLWDRGEVIGAAVLAFAGVAWFGWAQADPPSSWVPYLVVAVAAAGLGVATTLEPSAAAGAGGGVVFIGYAAWVLIGGLRLSRRGGAR